MIRDFIRDHRWLRNRGWKSVPLREAREWRAFVEQFEANRQRIDHALRVFRGPYDWQARGDL